MPARLLPLIAVLMLACHAAEPAPIVCDIAQSPNACLRCQAQHCGAALDRCYGAGFHEGRAIGPITLQRCEWDPATSSYSRNCTFSGGLGASGDAGFPTTFPDVPCVQVAACVQGCGCGTDCQAACGGDAGRTLYFANDPR